MQKIYHCQNDPTTIDAFKRYMQLKRLSDSKLLIEWYSTEGSIACEEKDAIIKEMERRMSS